MFIHEIHPGGPADKSGKLKIGDKIKKLNDIDYTNITNSKALENLRGAPEKVYHLFYYG